MILFVNPIADSIEISLLRDMNIIEQCRLEKGNDFSTFPEKIIEMIESFPIEEIWCICGPGAFTRMRIVTLTINTLSLTKNIVIKGCHFFDLIDSGNAILKANNQEYIVRVGHGETQLCAIADIPPGTYIGYGDENDFTENTVSIQYDESIHIQLKVFQESLPIKTLSPIYFKDPHITWSKKNTSRS